MVPTVGETVRLTGLANLKFNHANAVVVRELNADGRVGVRVLGTDAVVGIKPRNITYERDHLRGSCHTPPSATYGDKSIFFFSSDVDHDDPVYENDEVPERYAKWVDVKDKPLGEIFLYAHVHLPRVFSELNESRDFSILVSENLVKGHLGGKPLDPESTFRLVRADAATYCLFPAEVEQAILVGLQLLYVNGPRDLRESDRSIDFFVEDGTTNVQVNFEFNSVRVKMSLVEQPDAETRIGLTLGWFD